MQNPMMTLRGVSLSAFRSQTVLISVLIAVLGLVQAFGYYAMLWSDTPLGNHMFGLLVVWAGFLGVISIILEGFSRQIWWVILLFAVLFRILVYAAPPYLADDYERYLMDGRMVLGGVNPYNVAPLALPDMGGALVPKAEIKTIYPPLAQLIFAATVWFGDSLTVWRIMLFVPDMLSCVFLAGLLIRLGAPLSLLVLYLWNPLLLKEGLHVGHLELWTLAAVLGFFYLAAVQKNLAAALALSAAVLIKLIPLVLLPFWLVQMKSRGERIAVLAVAALALFAGFAMFFPHHPFGNIVVFLRHIQGDGILFSWLTLLLSANDAKLLLSALGGGVLLFRFLVLKDYVSKNALYLSDLFLILFLFSTMGFPWYLFLVIPWVILSQNMWLIAFMMFTHINYYTHQLNQEFFLWNILAVFCLVCGLLWQKGKYHAQIFDSH